MILNPYASFLGTQDARAVLAATPGLLHQAACALTPEQLEAPGTPTPEGRPRWSPRETLAHLADTEQVFSFRLRQTLAPPPPGQPRPLIQPFDQDHWAERYAGYDVPGALELFRAARAWNLKLIGGVSAAEWARETTHPERGTLTFGTIVETMAGHDLNHLAQLDRVVQSAARNEAAAGGV